MTNLQIYIDEFQILTSNNRNYLTERWKRLMFLARKAKMTEIEEELGYILDYSSPTMLMPLSILEEYVQSSENMPKLSKGTLDKEVMLIDLRFMELMHILSEMLKLEIVPSRMVKTDVA